LKRWALRLIGYDFDIEYVNSEKFGQADALSRLIQNAKQDVIDADLEEVVAALQETDTELQQIVNESVLTFNGSIRPPTCDIQRWNSC